MSDRVKLEHAIAQLVAEYEQLHCCEVSSLWVEHFDASRTIEVTATVGRAVKVA